MSRHRWGIWWLLMLTWNSAVTAFAATTGRFPLAGLMAFLTVVAGVMAYRDLTDTAAYSIRSDERQTP